jgi:hypothetical protein
MMNLGPKLNTWRIARTAPALSKRSANSGLACASSANQFRDSRPRLMRLFWRTIADKLQVLQSLPGRLPHGRDGQAWVGVWQRLLL